MTRRLALIMAIAVAVVTASWPAAAERLVTTVSRHQVMVNSSFTGTSIVLFGTIEPDVPTGRRRAGDYDLVVTVIGPRQTVVTRRKERMFGIWTNMASRTFVNVPAYLMMLANRPFGQVTDVDTLRRLQIGFDNVVLPQEISGDIGDVARDDPIRRNFLRLKAEHGLYVQSTNGVTLLTPTVFRAEIPLPAEAPVGNYDVDVKVFAEKALLVRQVSAFELIKVGFEQFVANAARDYGVLYGLTTAMMAILTGWFASVMFRRD
jgi:uncharacterized protein (TIGR02186 family)